MGESPRFCALESRNGNKKSRPRPAFSLPEDLVLLFFSRSGRGHAAFGSGSSRSGTISRSGRGHSTLRSRSRSSRSLGSRSSSFGCRRRSSFFFFAASSQRNGQQSGQQNGVFHLFSLNKIMDSPTPRSANDSNPTDGRILAKLQKKASLPLYHGGGAPVCCFGTTGDRRIWNHQSLMITQLISSRSWNNCRAPSRVVRSRRSSLVDRCSMHARVSS